MSCLPFGDVRRRTPLRQVLLALWRLRHDIFSFLAQYPVIFIPVERLMERLGLRHGKVELVGERTELVIEGCARSANTFALHAFRIAQNRRVVIAHHLHAPTQVIWAARNGIPIVVLIRSPRAVVLSAVIREPRLSLRQVVRDYIRFYTRIKPYYDNYVVATFDEVTTDFGGVIKKINQRFGTGFSRFDHTDENVKEVFRLAEQDDLDDSGLGVVNETRVARPAAERDRIRALLARELEGEGSGELIARSEAVYRDFMSHSS